MVEVNSHELVNQMLVTQEPAVPEQNVFLSTFSLNGSSEWVEGSIENIFIRQDFTLNISKLHFLKDVEMITPFPQHLVGFSFCTKGKSTFLPPQEAAPTFFKDGLSTFYKTTPHEGRAQFLAGTDYEAIAIHLSAEKFLEIIGQHTQNLPTGFLETLTAEDGHKLYVLGFDTRIRLLLNELSNIELKGLSRQFFIESKVLEIMGLLLESISTSGLSKEDEKKIKQCEELLRAQYNEPHSLLELSRKVGLNDFKLKQGFKALYGKPVFKYLQEYRMEQAKEALEKKQFSVSEVAEHIGYKSLGSFSNAFVSQFGIRPNELKSVSDKY